MIQPKKIRLIGISVIGILVFLVIFSSFSSSAPKQSNKATSLATTSNKLVDSKFDEKQNALINNQIGKGDVSEKPGSLKAEEDETPFNAAQEFLSVRALAPMTIFSKSYCPYSKKLKTLFAEHYQITPPPTVVELDKHKNGAEFQQYLAEMTGRKTVPNVLIGISQKSRGGCEDLVNLHEDGKLLDMLQKWGGKELQVKLIETPSNV